MLKKRVTTIGLLMLASLVTMSPAVRAAELPQDHEYQRVLRSHLATLKAADFEHGVTEPLTTPEPRADPEWRYRSLILATMLQPMIGSKRGAPSVTTPARFYTLEEIEAGDAVLRPPSFPDALMSFVRWDYEGNPYHDNRALKLRAYSSSVVNLVMLDAWLEAHPERGRLDWFAYQLVYIGSPYLVFRDELPESARQAYQAGVRQLAERMMAWGVQGDEPNMDFIAPVGLWYAAQVVDDPSFTQDVEDFARMMFTDPAYFHPAGFWAERGGLDVGFGGMANLFAVWAALASDWPFAREAVDRVYRLRAHLILPEPDGSVTGPAHFNNRVASPAYGDQWDWNGGRDYAASLVTDEAIHLGYPITLRHPTKGVSGMVQGETAEDFLAAAAPFQAERFNSGIGENPGYMKAEDIRPHPWQQRMWMTWDYPLSLNPGFDFYPDGAWAHRQALVDADSPMLRNPFERGETFVRNFENAFVVTRQAGYAAIVHTGPIGRQHPDDTNFHFSGPLGFGGGQLSAFWTPNTGAAWQGRRGGQQWDKPFERLDQWRIWPIHAVSGETVGGRVFTSARIADPVVTTDLSGTGGTVTAEGPLVGFRTGKDPLANDPAKARDNVLYDAPLDGRIDYQRTFEIGPAGLKVTTTLTGDGKETLAELYETLPVFHRDDHRREAPVTTIRFQVDGTWTEATDQPTKNVLAIRLSRFDGEMEVRFDRPRVAMLSPEPWRTSFVANSISRTILVDLLENDGKPAAISGETKVSYTVRPVE